MSKRSWLSSRRPALPAPDVVGGDAHAGDPAGLDRPAQPVDVLDRLALGELEDDVARVQAVADEHPEQGVDAEVVRSRGSAATG